MTNTVSARQWRDEPAEAHHAHRGRDRRVLRRPQGGAPGHHRDVPGADPEAEGRLPAPRACSTPATGVWWSTTRCTCCPRRCSG
nr:hypothetical protein [Angustibacter aerolatus]